MQRKARGEVSYHSHYRSSDGRQAAFQPYGITQPGVKIRPLIQYDVRSPLSSNEARAGAPTLL